jgi:hypothetical protein
MEATAMSEQSQFPLTPTELMKRVATKGDLATVLLAAPIGFVGDILLSLTGIISPGACAVVTASTALGLKNAVHAALSSKASAPEPRVHELADANQLRRSKKLVYALRQELEKAEVKELEPLYEYEQRLTKEINLFEDDLSTESTLEMATSEALEFYRGELGLADGREKVGRLNRSRRLNVQS